MPTLAEIHEQLRVESVDGAVNLAGYDAGATPFVDSKSDAKSELKAMKDTIFDAHELLFAMEESSVLLLLQGLDCSGKNGTIKHVVINMNPAGVRTSSYKAPTEEELEHHFLWRYKNNLPSPGQFGVFDRSYYEDAIVPSVNGKLDASQIDERIGEINQFERELADNGTVLIKCMLHISYDEQRYRFLRRLRRDDKRWKFDVSDIETRRRWDDYIAAYSDVLGRTTSDEAPWFVVPADHKWYRNWIIAHLIVETLDSMGLAYPQPPFDVEDLRRQLEPPK